MKSHKDLLEEAEELAESMKQAEKIDWSFKYSYVANHELRIVFERLQTQSRLIWGLLIVIVLWIVKSVLVG